MRGLIKTLLVCGALIATALATAGPATAGPATAGPATAGPATAGPTTAVLASAAAATSDSCSPTVSNIHWGTVAGRATIMFTGQVVCNFSDASIYVHGVLFACGGQRPEENKDADLADCGYGTNDQTLTPQEAGVMYSVTVPASSEVFTGAGYYAPMFNFTNDGGNNVGTTTFGTPAYCTSGGTCKNTTYAS
jgi:hypothetical protein